MMEAIRQSATIATTPFVINIGGPSAAGKSTLASNLSYELGEADVLAVDDYLAAGLWDQTREYQHDPIDPTEPPHISGISPDIWDLDKLEKDIELAQAGSMIDRPLFDEHIKERVGYEPFSPREYLIFEGGQAFHPRFFEYADFSVHVRATLHDRLMRKIVRSTKQYQLDEVDEVLSRYVARDEMANQYYDPLFCEAATCIVENVAKPGRDYVNMSEDTFVNGRSRMLRPFAKTGILHGEEELSVIDNGNDLHVAYSVNERLLVCRRISSATLKLMQTCYELDR